VIRVKEQTRFVVEDPKDLDRIATWARSDNGDPSFGHITSYDSLSRLLDILERIKLDEKRPCISNRW